MERDKGTKATSLTLNFHPGTEAKPSSTLTSTCQQGCQVPTLQNSCIHPRILSTSVHLTQYPMRRAHSGKSPPWCQNVLGKLFRAFVTEHCGRTVLYLDPYLSVEINMSFLGFVRERTPNHCPLVHTPSAATDISATVTLLGANFTKLPSFPIYSGFKNYFYSLLPQCLAEYE